MKKKLILSFCTLLVASTSYAGIPPEVGADLTPSNYVFDNLEEGPFIYNKLYYSAYNVENSWPNTEVPFDNGLVALGYDYAGDKKFINYYAESSSILDLGGEVGKVFCLKGFDCPDSLFPYGRKASSKVDGVDGGDWGAGFHINFYSPLDPSKTLIGTDKTFTLRIVSKIITPNLNDTESTAQWEWRSGKTGELWAFSKLYSAEFENDTDWNVTEMTSIPSSTRDGHFPFQFKTAISAKQLINSVILIKEIKFIADTKVEGASKSTPVITSEMITLEMDPPASNKDLQADSDINYTISGDKISLNNLQVGDKITISSLAGIVVADLTAGNSTETVTLGKGYYTVCAADKVFKVLN